MPFSLKKAATCPEYWVNAKCIIGKNAQGSPSATLEKVKVIGLLLSRERIRISDKTEIALQGS